MRLSCWLYFPGSESGMLNFLQGKILLKNTSLSARNIYVIIWIFVRGINMSQQLLKVWKPFFINFQGKKRCEDQGRLEKSSSALSRVSDAREKWCQEEKKEELTNKKTVLRKILQKRTSAEAVSPQEQPKNYQTVRNSTQATSAPSNWTFASRASPTL